MCNLAGHANDTPDSCRKIVQRSVVECRKELFLSFTLCWWTKTAEEEVDDLASLPFPSPGPFLPLLALDAYAAKREVSPNLLVRVLVELVANYWSWPHNPRTS